MQEQFVPASTDGGTEHFDVLIVGAGLSGIDAAVHLRTECPDKRFAILEGRQDLGGTWDLFRYPGIRSDSDMYTLGYGFKPWRDAKAIADGASIKAYIAEAAAEWGVDRDIRYGHKVVAADWSTAEARWHVSVEHDGLIRQLSCTFLFMCAGYYSYSEAYRPTWPNEAAFGGRIVHPQFWPDDLDYRGKRVVVIGSGATAVTLVPEMAREAEHVTMLQRSPTYVVSRPSVDGIAERLKARLPAKLAYGLTRWKNVLMGWAFYSTARRRPAKVKKTLVDLVQSELGADSARHFTPDYNPWDQRLCLVPDADLFKTIREGRASVTTNVIDHFTETGIRLVSGDTLPADIIVTATGLKLNLVGDAAISIDRQPVNLSKAMNYKGCMFSDIPNFASIFGYTNASWTLKADLVCQYVCRLLKHMDRTKSNWVMPRRDPKMAEEPFLDFASGYVQRALDALPKQGSKRPWKLYQNYPRDVLTLRFGRIDDGVLEFGRSAAQGQSGRAAA